MEYCSLNDAFPAVGPTPPGCRGADSGSTARKEERRRAKKAKGPQIEMLETTFDEARARDNTAGAPYDTDPDRPAHGQRTDAPAPMMAPGGAVEGMTPVVYLPVEPSNRAATKAVPKWFGTSVDEGFTPYTGSLSTDADAGAESEYMLKPSFDQAFKARGADKPTGGAALPPPNLDDRWKPMTAPANALTAYYERFQPPASAAKAGKAGATDTLTDALEIKKRLDKIFARLDDMEARRACTDNSNTEVGMFVMTGVFVLFFMDLLVRKTANLRVYPS